MNYSSSCDRQGPKVVNTDGLSGAVGQGDEECRRANCLARGFSCLTLEAASYPELFNDWGGRGYDDSVPGEVTKTPSSGDRTT